MAPVPSTVSPETETRSHDDHVSVSWHCKRHGTGLYPVAYRRFRFQVGQGAILRKCMILSVLSLT